MPAYVVTVLIAYAVYHFRVAGPNPGHTWIGLLRNITLTQIYTDNYRTSICIKGMTQMWSLAVEASFYVALPALLAYLLWWCCAEGVGGQGCWWRDRWR